VRRYHLRKYNHNDVGITAALFEELKDDINLRLFISREENVDVLDASNQRIADVLLEKKYSKATGQQKMIVAAKNPEKTDVTRKILQRHSGQKTLLFVDFIEQGKRLADELDLPFIYGETPYDERKAYYSGFRDGEITALIVSRIGDEGIDLPNAEVAIITSTRGSSRQQTGQRGGRTMRPEGDSQVYILLTRGSGEQDWGRESTQYLVQKGADIRTYDWKNRPW